MLLGPNLRNKAPTTQFCTAGSRRVLTAGLSPWLSAPGTACAGSSQCPLLSPQPRYMGDDTSCSGEGARSSQAGNTGNLRYRPAGLPAPRDFVLQLKLSVQLLPEGPPGTRGAKPPCSARRQASSWGQNCPAATGAPPPALSSIPPVLAAPRLPVLAPQSLCPTTGWV